MWRNTETKEFVQWMKERNDNIPLGDKTLRGLGIYGMDVRLCGR
jgi:erythromycin esterase-like protein